MPRKRTKAAAAAPAEDEDWAGMKVPALRKACQDRGLDATGNKAALVQRLQDQASDDDQPSPPKVKKEESFNTKARKAIATAGKQEGGKSTHKRDAQCTVNADVYEDYDCMLNQTNIGNNNNKYYIIQVLRKGKKFWTWNRWGRVGETGQNALKEVKDAAAAIKDFESKFKDKTKNEWANRDDFVPVAGKYTYLEMADEDSDEEEEDTMDNMTFGRAAKILSDPKRASKLDADTRSLMELIFNVEMIQGQMQEMELDIKKMPLGKLSKIQIAKGFDTLVAIEDELKKNKPNKATLEQLSSQFFTQIPHSFGRNRPPVIDCMDVIRKKKDMLLVLSDIELAQSMQKEKEKEMKDLNEADANYKRLECKLESMDPKKDKKEYDVIMKYMDATKPGHLKLMHVWRMERHSEPKRFKLHQDIKFRKLLWHGTNLAVVAAILKSGLRIMPHSGGRVGKGIYFASRNEMSSYFVMPATFKWKGRVMKVGLMFLAEVALGKEKEITKDDCSLVTPPPGFNSVVARGKIEPDPKKDTEIVLDGNRVVVPQGKPIPQGKFKNSFFYDSEYLVYRESQVRLRYLIALDYTTN